MFNTKYIFIHGPFSIAVLVYRNVVQFHAKKNNIASQNGGLVQMTFCFKGVIFRFLHVSFQGRVGQFRIPI